MLEGDFVYSIITHQNTKALLKDLLNGTSSWFYATLAELKPDESADQLRARIRAVLQDYLATLFRLQRRYDGISCPYSRFLYGDMETAEAAITYLLKTLKATYKENFMAAIVALWIALERREEHYEAYARRLGRVNDSAEVPERFCGRLLLFYGLSSKHTVDIPLHQ